MFWSLLAMSWERENFLKNLALVTCTLLSPENTMTILLSRFKDHMQLYEFRTPFPLDIA